MAIFGTSASETVLFAPIWNDSRFVEFKIHYKPQSTSVSSWSLVRTIVEKVAEDEKHYIVKFPIGAQYQEKTPKHLRNLTIIDSRAPGASRYKRENGDVYFDLLSPMLRELDIGHVYVATDSSTSIVENAKSFSASGTVVILGGDTSAHEFVNALAMVNPKLHQELRLVIVPTGTGNALAISCGLSTPLIAVRHLFLSDLDDFRPLSTFSVRFPPSSEASLPADQQSAYCETASANEYRVLVVASWGFHSALVADSDSMEMRTQFCHNPNQRFKEAARLNLDTILQTYKGSVHYNNTKLSGPEHSYLLFTVVTHLEAGFCISPSSKPPSSNNLHVILVKSFASLEEQGKQLMEIMMKAFNNGEHIGHPLVTYKELTSDVVVNVDDQPKNMRRWCIDGKIITVPAGKVVIGSPTHDFNGWHLKILARN